MTDLLSVTRKISDDSDSLFDTISEIKDANDKAIEIVRMLEYKLYGSDEDFSPERAVAFQINYESGKTLFNATLDYLILVNNLIEKGVVA